jgi:hypothetical protein
VFVGENNFGVMSVSYKEEEYEDRYNTSYKKHYKGRTYNFNQFEGNVTGKQNYEEGEDLWGYLIYTDNGIYNISGGHSDKYTRIGSTSKKKWTTIILDYVSVAKATPTKVYAKDLYYKDGQTIIHYDKSDSSINLIETATFRSTYQTKTLVYSKSGVYGYVRYYAPESVILTKYQVNSKDLEIPTNFYKFVAKDDAVVYLDKEGLLWAKGISTKGRFGLYNSNITNYANPIKYVANVSSEDADTLLIMDLINSSADKVVISNLTEFKDMIIDKFSIKSSIAYVTKLLGEKIELDEQKRHYIRSICP